MFRLSSMAESVNLLVSQGKETGGGVVTFWPVKLTSTEGK